MPDPSSSTRLNDALEEFHHDFADAHLACEHALIELEHRQDDNTLIDGLMANINTLKNRMIYVGLRDLSVLLQGIEDVLAAVARHELSHDTLLNDVLLLAMDRTRQLVDARLEGQPTPPVFQDVPEVARLLGLMASPMSQQERLATLRRVMGHLDPEAMDEADDLPDARPLPKRPATELPQADDIESLLALYGIAINEDMRLFIGITGPIEARSMYWNDSTLRILKLALAMNRHAGNPIVPAQLAAAVMLHDVGMAFLPVSILHKKVRLEPHEIALLQAHPRQAHALLSSMAQWQAAADAVLQHHERVDGRGYPQGLPGDRICDGAKIISIADTFEARTHERAYSGRIKRPFIRAILEINNCSGSQFDPHWVGVFNEVARTLDVRS